MSCCGKLRAASHSLPQRDPSHEPAHHLLPQVRQARYAVVVFEYVGQAPGLPLVRGTDPRWQPYRD
jgi:hypothetical protein